MCFEPGTNELQQHLETMALYKCQIVIAGDLNIHIERESDAAGIRLLDLLGSFDCVQHINEPTHTAGGTLDHVYQSCPRVGWTRGSGRVGSGRVGSRFCRILAGRVGSGQHFGFISFLLIISWHLNQYESSNTTFGLIDFHRYLIYNNYLIKKLLLHQRLYI